MYCCASAAFTGCQSSGHSFTDGTVAPFGTVPSASDPWRSAYKTAGLYRQAVGTQVGSAGEAPDRVQARHQLVEGLGELI